MKFSNGTGLSVDLLQNVFQAIPEAVIIADPDLKIISTNRAFEQIFGWSGMESDGQLTAKLFGSDQAFNATVEKYYHPDLNDLEEYFITEYKRKNGDKFQGRTVANAMKNESGETIGFITIVRDLTPEINRENEALRLQSHLANLVQITSVVGIDVNQQINEALKLTTEFLGCEIGIISNIKGTEYTVQNFYPENSGLHVGQTFELGNTYCSITLEANDVLAIDHMKASEYHAHPCYPMFGLESYVGIPLIVNKERIGTVNFSSSHPRDKKFSNNDLDLVRLVAAWMGELLWEQKMMQELQDSREKYRLISERSNDLVCLHKPDGTYTYVSPSVERILGFTPEELIGRDPYSLFHPDDIDRIASESHEQVIAGHPVLNFEYRIQNKKGDYIWVNTSTDAILDESGQVIGLQTSSREVTERKRLEILYSQSQKMAKVGGWEYELDTGALYWTDEVYRIHDIEVGEPIFVEEALSYYPEEDGSRALLQNMLDQTVETGTPIDLELPIITAKGRKRFVRTIINGMSDGKRIYKLYGTFQDITERKINEIKQREINEKLEKMIQTNHEINSVVGHDLKSPLTSILGLIDLVIMNYEGSINLKKEDLVNSFELIRNSTKNMSQLLDDLFNWSRIQTGNMGIRVESLSLKAVLSPTLNLLASVASQKEISLNFVCNEGNEVMADRIMLPTIIRNFISNAIKFSVDGDKVDIICSETSSHWIIEVRDYGEGMDKEVLANLFHPTRHPSRIGTANERGTGLGLKLSHKMADLMGAQIKVKSKVGAGTSFKLVVPK